MSNPPATANILEELFRVIASRRDASPESSYTAKLLHDGRAQIVRKVGEEAVELTVAALAETDDRIASESADLLYHLLVLWADAGLTPEDIWRELACRQGTSGLDEKAGRPD